MSKLKNLVRSRISEIEFWLMANEGKVDIETTKCVLKTLFLNKRMLEIMEENKKPTVQ